MREHYSNVMLLHEFSVPGGFHNPPATSVSILICGTNPTNRDKRLSPFKFHLYGRGLGGGSPYSLRFAVKVLCKALVTFHATAVEVAVGHDLRSAPVAKLVKPACRYIYVVVITE